ncbi:unnamed protein product [Adineta steineri]|uniref:Uncharacterized protein n=2 Tax=Adineta steineri TaxID=433720 RepID=A0A818KM81_9BILA|nr:unnamed protein product [Adineta steineri]CAF3564357.1 unnamed protein product [Adineta steineri]
MLNSPLLQTDSDKRLRSSIARNHKTDLLIVPTTEKLDDINNNHYDEHENNSIIDSNKTDVVLNDNENDSTLLTTTTTTTVEVKVKTTKTSSRKRKLNAINDMNSDNINKQLPVTKKKKNQRMAKTDDKTSNNNKKSNFKTIDQSSITDESSFGSCEPGTSVVLQGIVWNETDKGVLVVNITWRGKTYVGALLNTTEQNWAPPRYKSEVRSTKQNHNRDQQLTSIPSSHDSTERILRNGKRRGSSTTVTPNSATKNNSFKIPDTPPLPSKNDETSSIIEKFITPSSININDEDETNSLNEEKRNTTISNDSSVGGGGGSGGSGSVDDEIGDNYSSRSISPTTSGTSTSSSSPPLLSTNTENQSLTIPVDLSNSKTTINVEQKMNDTLIPYHFTNDMVNPSSYFSSLHGSTNPFTLPSFNKLPSQSSTMSPSSSYLPIPSQLYFNSLTLPHYSSVSSLSKSSH